MCYHFFVNKFFSESGDKMENINVIEQKNNVIDINTSVENMIFQLTELEFYNLRSQIALSNKNNR